MWSLWIPSQAGFILLISVLGVSGMEDKLQEGVGETISSLRLAGMSVWVLTGDKQVVCIV